MRRRLLWVSTRAFLFVTLTLLRLLARRRGKRTRMSDDSDLERRLMRLKSQSSWAVKDCERRKEGKTEMSHCHWVQRLLWG